MANFNLSWLLLCLVLMWQASGQRQQNSAAEERIRHVIQTLPSGSALRYRLEKGARGDGLRQPWMDRMRQAGVRRALVEVRFVWRGHPREMKVERTLFFSEYGGGCSQIKHASRLEHIRSTGLDQELQRVALQRVERGEGFWGIHPARERHGKPGRSVIEFLDDEWLPIVPPLFGLFDMQTEARAPLDDLEHVIALGDAAEVEKFIVEEKISATDRDEALFSAASADDPCVVKLLLMAGANPNTQSTYGTTPLLNAVSARQLGNIRALLAAGVDVSVKDQQGRTPLIFAAEHGEDASAVIELLLEAGANPNTAMPSGATALMRATLRQSGSALRFLLAHGAEVDARDSDGNTALMWAADHGNTEAVRALLGAGADPTATNKAGLTALEIARQERHATVVEILQKATTPKSMKGSC